MSLEQALAAKAAALSAAEEEIKTSAGSVVALLACSPAVLEAATELAAAASASCVVESGFVLPFQPRSFRDAGSYVQHMSQAVRGFVAVAGKEGHLLQMALSQIGKSLRLPFGVNPAARPGYYHGNPCTFIADGDEAPWPSTCGWLDYELEVAVLITRPVSREATAAEVAAALGGFVLINDFSARDVQADELVSVGFGFVKCKAAATAMGLDVVSSDELWAPGDRGSLFEGRGLRVEVKVNGEAWRGAGGEQSSTGMVRACSLEALVRYMALDEGLQPGELIGMGTVPNCCGLEIGRWLQPGDEVALSAEGLGTLTNTVGHPPATAQNFKEVDCGGGAPPGRLRTALRCALLAVVLPPLTFALMVGGALSALLWRGPAGVLRSPAPTVPAIRRAADKRR